MSNPIQRVRMLTLAVALVATGPGAVPAYAEQGPAPSQTKVIVVPMNGPQYYSAAREEMTRIVRGAAVQKPAAVVLHISSPGGSLEVAWAIAEQIAWLSGTKVVAYVNGEYGGLFGPGAIALLAADEVFIAPENVIEPRSVISPPKGLIWNENPTLSGQQVDQIRKWSEQAEREWPVVREWLEAYGLIALPDAPATQESAAQAPASQPGQLVLKAEEAASLDEVLRKLGLADAWVITWPDPVARAHEQMLPVLQVVDEHYRQMMAAVEAARQADPRAHKYALRDVYRTYTWTAIAPGEDEDDKDRVLSLQQIDTVVSQDVFEDGGASWRARTDRTVAYVRQALTSNRRLAALVARYPELNLDAQALQDVQAQLQSWLGLLRAERGVQRPPQ